MILLKSRKFDAREIYMFYSTAVVSVLLLLPLLQLLLLLLPLLPPPPPLLLYVCVVVSYICRALPDVYIDKLFSFIASQLDNSAEKGFYVTWNQLLLESHGTRLKQRSLSVMPAVNNLQKSLRAVQDVNKMYAVLFL